MQVPSSPSSLERLRKNGCMDADRFPTGSRVEAYWPGDEEWFAAAVLKTRTMSHNIDGAQTLCREIFCYYLCMIWTCICSGILCTRTTCARAQRRLRPTRAVSPTRFPPAFTSRFGGEAAEAEALASPSPFMVEGGGDFSIVALLSISP